MPWLGVAAPGFFTAQNLSDLLLANMPVLIVALGMTLVILCGQIDISVGSVFAICSVAAGELANMGLPTPLAGAGACAIGAAFGALNGALVAYLRIPAIVVTLACGLGLVYCLLLVLSTLAFWFVRVENLLANYGRLNSKMRVPATRKRPLRLSCMRPEEASRVAATAAPLAPA